jgi:hypothetical protein
MPGFYARRTGFSRSAAITANRAGSPYAAAHHERLHQGLFEGNKRVSIHEPLMIERFCHFSSHPTENWLCFALAPIHSTIFQIVLIFSIRWALFRIFPAPRPSLANRFSRIEIG